MNLELYHRWTCPYSAKVRAEIGRLELEDQIQFHEIGEDEGAAERLQQLTGKTQVPCLVVDGEPMLESNDIVHWFNDNLSSSPQMTT
jgi:glutaredoxin 3